MACKDEINGLSWCRCGVGLEMELQPTLGGEILKVGRSKEAQHHPATALSPRVEINWKSGVGLTLMRAGYKRGAAADKKKSGGGEEVAGGRKNREVSGEKNQRRREERAGSG
jgi:hypothetical protein